MGAFGRMFIPNYDNDKEYSQTEDDKKDYCPKCKKKTLQRPQSKVTLLGDPNKWYCYGHSGTIK